MTIAQALLYVSNKFPAVALMSSFDFRKDYNVSRRKFSARKQKAKMTAFKDQNNLDNYLFHNLIAQYMQK